MEKYVLEYLDYLIENRSIAKNTADAYELDLYHFLRFLYKNQILRLERVTDTNCNSYLLALEQEGKKPASIARKMAALRGFFDFCIRKGYVKEDPTEQLKVARVTRKEVEILEPKQMKKLLSLPDTMKAKGIRDKAILELLYATGMKASELAGLCWRDVNLKLGYVCVHNGKRERIVPLHETAVEALGKYQTMRREQEENCAEDGTERENEFKDSILFPARNGEPFTRQGLWKLVRAYGVKLGVPELSPQTIRDSFIAHMLQNGADLYAMQELLGVSDLSFAGQHVKAGGRAVREVYQKAHPLVH
ncbi:MAG: tyrosine-type recombinase/integrase [Lachnospiraceae bacterium]|nr:tyrosine-type recombinase/integrase [Lachnospiraceae bacterium]